MGSLAFFCPLCLFPSYVLPPLVINLFLPPTLPPRAASLLHSFSSSLTQSREDQEVVYFFFFSSPSLSFWRRKELFSLVTFLAFPQAPPCVNSSTAFVFRLSPALQAFEQGSPPHRLDVYPCRAYQIWACLSPPSPLST